MLNKSLSLTKILENLLRVMWWHADKRETISRKKNGKTKRAKGLGGKTREEMGKGIKMTALRLQRGLEGGWGPHNPGLPSEVKI